MEGPVLEEFIPIKKRASPDCDEEDDDEDEQHSHKPKISKDNKNDSDKKKSDWLRSVQLWHPDPPAEEVHKKEMQSLIIIFFSLLFLFFMRIQKGISDLFT